MFCYKSSLVAHKREWDLTQKKKWNKTLCFLEIEIYIKDRTGRRYHVLYRMHIYSLLLLEIIICILCILYILCILFFLLYYHYCYYCYDVEVNHRSKTFAWNPSTCGPYCHGRAALRLMLHYIILYTHKHTYTNSSKHGSLSFLIESSRHHRRRD